MNIKNRLKEYLDFKGISDYRFQKDIGVSNGYLNNGDTIRSDYLESIISVYSDLSIYWLLTGEGDMILKSQEDECNPEGEEGTSGKWLKSKIDVLIDDNSRNSRSIEKMVEIADRNNQMLDKMMAIFIEKGLDISADEKEKESSLSKG